MNKSLTILFLLAFASGLFAQVSLIDEGDTWRYNATGQDLGTAWTAPGFNDALWLPGQAEFGFGDGDETTPLFYGLSASNKYPTYYFRKDFSLTQTQLDANGDYVLRVRRDDGVVIYLNGVEIFRNNMPSGTPTYNTFASSECTDDGNEWLDSIYVTLPNIGLDNVLAVELHTSSAADEDVSFDLELVKLIPAPAGVLERGPYLQVATSNSIVVKWRTDVASGSVVKYGYDAYNLEFTAFTPGTATDHEVQLSGLEPDTKYFYSIGSIGTTLAGEDTNYYFITSPIIGTEKKTTVWVIGDCGNNSTNQKNVRDQYNEFMNGKETNVWLTLGDNAYNFGFDTEFQTNFFEIYQDEMRHMPLWPATGNHDYNNLPLNQISKNVPYFDIFTLPANGEAGGVPSGTEAFYSYDYGNIHFMSLDSYGIEENQYRLYDTLGPQVQWIKQDLEANTQKWTIAYWHHPPFTMGSHNSDAETELTDIRANFIQILERYGVDLVLCGHSHSYERSKLMKGHYGMESTFDAAQHHLSTSSANYDGSTDSCPYIKSEDNHDGTVYIVAGSAGQLGGSAATYPHDAMHFSDVDNGGSLTFEIEGNRLDARWVCADGAIRDYFTIMKDVNKKVTVNVPESNPVLVEASYIGDYNWTSGQTNKEFIVYPTTDTTFIVNDGKDCIADTFEFTVSPSCNVVYTDVRSSCEPFTWVDGITYTESNNTAIYNFVGGAANGCDSVVVLDFTYGGVEATVSYVNGFLVSGSTGDSYQWVDCDNNYQGIWLGTDRQFLPTENGHYALVLTTGDCSDTSACYNFTRAGLKVLDEVPMRVYPNPAKDRLHIDFGKVFQEANVRIYSELGQLLDQKRVYNLSLVSMNMNYKPGTYIVEIINDKGETRHFPVIQE